MIPPDLEPADAERVASAHWGIPGKASPLPGDRDRNFRIDGPGGDRWVLKAAFDSPGEREGHESQRRVLDLLHQAWPGGVAPFPKVVDPRAPGPVVEPDGGGRPCLIRMVEFVPGTPLASVRRRADSLYGGLGRLLGRMHRILADAPEGLGRRDFDWDLRTAGTQIERHRARISDRDRGALIDRLVSRWNDGMAGLVEALPMALIHNDANDHNVLVDLGRGPTPADRAPRVSGLIDFGDLVRSWRVGDLAVAGAYLVLDRPDPLPVLESLVAAYHDVTPLLDEELAALFPLLRLRLGLSVSMSAFQGEARPEDPYVRISETPAWEALARTEAIPEGVAEAHLRRAVGVEPSPGGARLRRWMEGGDLRPASVLAGLDPGAVVSLDLSPGSLELSQLPGKAGPSQWADVIFGIMGRAGARVGIGGHAEVRRWFDSPAFEVPGNDGTLHRTAHLGLDLFVPAGTPVHAPLDGVVVRTGQEDGAPEHGPSVVLEHRMPFEDEEMVFRTIYRHLSMESVDRITAGDVARRGEPFAAVGDAEENGGWPPHLHFQILADPPGGGPRIPSAVLPRDLEIWRSLSPHPGRLLPVAVPEPGPRPDSGGPATPQAREILEYRARHLGPNLSVSYRRPLHIVRGWMQHLWDASGQRYLDGVNNVAHVGHCHPKVVEAVRKQSGVLNTNTRYLHGEMVQYVRELLATFPEPLRVVYLVCSGSEANELALRLARAHTGRRDTLVLEAGYHGNTGLLVEASGYKSRGPGGTGPGEWVHTAPLPDPYRGIHREGATQDGVGRAYAAEVESVVTRAEGAGRPVGAFLAESLPGCGGQIVLPEGFLAGAYASVRAAGAICIADEVQVGFGRVGEKFWGFETQRVIPDIVTLGKPIGNGHPMGAVVTTEEIAASFDNGMEYFNTFGGNPVSAAVGRAVLAVIREEDLQARAARVGATLTEGLLELAGRHPIIGQVRGLGLFLGVELVVDRESRDPAGSHAAYVSNRLRDRGFLVSTDGPDHNVLKLKPPLQFSHEDATRLVEALDVVLGEEPVRV